MKKLKDQSRWNTYGKKRLGELKKHPKKIYFSPLAAYPELKKIFDHYVKDLKGKKILDLGSGFGDLSVFLSLKGAEVVGLDSGDKLIEAAKYLADANSSSASFVLGRASHLPFQDKSFDIVLCMGVLHHLGTKEAKLATGEAFRVLKKGGFCFANEPVEDCRIFEFVQNLLPIKNKSTGVLRPSIFQRKKWKLYTESLDERAFQSKELIDLFDNFSSLSLIYHGCINRFDRVWPKAKKYLDFIDSKLLKLKVMRRFSRTVVVFALKK